MAVAAAAAAAAVPTSSVPQPDCLIVGPGVLGGCVHGAVRVLLQAQPLHACMGMRSHTAATPPAAAPTPCRQLRRQAVA